ncbi:MAG: hypothetical protein ABR915_05655 [Thermoguttaceae bacterium]|jgi:hypothetical protein
MESVIRDVKSLESDQRHLYEAVVGHALRENQGIILHVIELGAEPDQATRRAALSRAVEIARQGREAAKAQGTTEADAGAAIDAAIQEVRQSER